MGSKSFAIVPAAVFLAASAAASEATTIITSPFRGVTHIFRDEPAGAVVPRKVVMNILEIDTQDAGIGFLATPGNGAAPGEYTGQTTAQFVTQYGLQAAINGDFYSAAGTGPGGEIYRDVTNLSASNGTGISTWPGGGGRGALNITADNDAQIVKPPTGGTGTFNTDPVVALYNAVGGSQRILNNGNNIVGTTPIEVDLHPRTVVGVKGDTLYLFVVDGRSAESGGMNLVEIADFLASEYGVEDALNFDGGGSTTMVMANPTATVVNAPSDGSLRTNGNNLGVFARAWQTWNVNNNGNWSAASNWSGGVPNSVGAAARFAGAISAPRTITANNPITVGTMTFEGNQAYTIAGASLITLDVPVREAAIDLKTASSHRVLAPIEIRDFTDITVAAGGSLEIGGALNNPLAQRITKLGSGTLTLSGTQTHSAGTDFRMDEGTLVLQTDLGTGVALKPRGGVTQIASPQNLNTLNLDAPATVLVSPGGNNTIKATNVQTPVSATLDLADNNLIIDYAGVSTLGTWNGSSYGGKTSLIARGRGSDGGWDHSGINSSAAAASEGLMALGIAEASEVFGISGGQTQLWFGQTADGTSLLVRYTFGGDANLDGKLNIDDYVQIDSSISNQLTGWWNGDFNYDGKLNIDDYVIIDGNISNQGAMLAGGVSAIPEPGGAALLAIALTALARRSRRRPLPRA